MGLQRTRDYLLSLPRVEETLQWDLLVYWVLDKAVGGKMFAVLEPEPGQPQVTSFAVPTDHYYQLLETEGVRPAPYLARAHWVAVEDWQVFPERELHAHLHDAYDRVESKLPPRVQRLITLPTGDYRAAVRQARATAKASTSKRSRPTPNPASTNR